MKPPPGGDAESPLTTEVYQLEAWQARLQRLAANLAEGTSDRLHENTVRWIEIDAKNNAIVRVVRCPLEVAGDLAEWVYRNLKTVVMTSATLTVRKRFDYLFGRIGLNRVVDRPVQPVALPTPFDFQRQALLLIPTDIAQPNERDYRDDAVDYIEEALRITRGRAFVLFTSYSALNYTFQQLEPRLRAVGITPLKQGAAARTHLLERFRGDVGSVLFGTDSFWEGVDVAGEALQCVILPKLPFRVPTEPILEARAEAIEEAGGNPFMELTVPQAVIKFRQGFGRLIRRTTDRGTVLILDRRVIGKYYGRIFLESLPGMRVVRGPRDEVMEALEAFHGGPVA
jgi:ATP-dependent DNA helicase DinG